jgi:acetyl esterase
VNLPNESPRRPARRRGRLRLPRRSSPAAERLLRAVFGDPPRSDRGIELDLPTHVLLSLMEIAKLGGLEKLPVHAARRRYEQDGGLLDLPSTDLAERHDFEIPGPGGPLPCRLYRPHGARAAAPLLLWLHGGGYVIGGLDTHACACAMLADRSGCLVVALDYRKAPEHKFPAASDDALASFRWLREHAGDLGGDPERVALGGDSAGANLSAGVCHRLRNTDDEQPALQVLLYPMTQFRAPFPSRTHFGEGAMLTTRLIEWFRGHYLGSPEQGNDPLVSPLLAPRFEGLAPAIIRTAGFDPLRDEGEAYAEILRAAGVEVDYRCHERLIHGFLTMGGASPAMREAVIDLGDDLALALGAKPT